MTLDRRDYKTSIPQLESRLKELEQVGAKGLANFNILQDLIEKEILERERLYLKQDTSINTIVVKMYYALVDPADYSGGKPPSTTQWSETMPNMDATSVIVAGSNPERKRVLWYKSKTLRNGVVTSETEPQTVQVMDGVFSFINSVASDSGWTTINGSIISTGKIQSHDGNTYFDLDNNIIRMGGTSYVKDRSVSDLLDKVDNTASDFATKVIEYDNDIQDLQNQIDGNITTWFYAYVPTNSNAPASDWISAGTENVHLGDLFYNTTTGYAYRWQSDGATPPNYSWLRITDSDVTKALADAAAAQDTADAKRRVFVTTPTPPYDIGDLWAGGSSGDIKKCKTAKIDGQSYSASDWELASKYTDDTAVTNLVIGGRNLHKNSDLIDSSWTIVNGSHDTDEVVTLTRVSSETRIYQTPANGYWVWKPNTTYTASIDVKGNSGGETFQFTCNGGGTVTYISGRVNTLTTSWTRYKCTFTTGDSVSTNSMTYHLTSNNSTIQVRLPKLELGNKATDWTPAPEELRIKTSSASGTVASFNDASEYPALDIATDIKPNQNINGYDHAWKGGDGRNLFPIHTYNDTMTHRGVTATFFRNKSGAVEYVNINGTNDGTGNSQFLCAGTVANPLSDIDFSKKYYISGGGTDIRVMLWLYDANKTYIQALSASGYGVQTLIDVPTAVYYVALIEIPTGKSVSNKLIYPMLRLATDEDKTYEPYENQYWVGGSGKNLLKNNTTTSTVNGVTFTVNSDGTIKATNTATADAQKIISIDTDKLYGDFYFVGCTGSQSATYNVYIWDNTTNARAKQWDGTTASNSSTDGTLQQVKLVQGHSVSFNCRVMNGKNAGGVVFKPMICKATETSPMWQPYENLSTISGYDAVNVYTTGRNLLHDADTMDGWWKGSGATISGGVATLTGSSSNWNGAFSTSKLDAKLLDGKTKYALSFDYNCTSSCATNITIAGSNSDVNSSAYQRTRYDSWGTHPTLQSTGGAWARYTMPARTINPIAFPYPNSLTSTLDVISWYVQFYARTNGVSLKIRNVQIEIADTATAYDTNQVETHTTSLPSTIYGGTLDVTDGTLTVDTGYINLTSVTFASSNNTDQTHKNAIFGTSATNVKLQTTTSAHSGLICDKLIDVTWNDAYSEANEYYGVFTYYTSTTYPIRFCLPKSLGITTLAQFNTWLTSIGGLQIAYPLATPQVYQLTPQQVQLLKGTNNVWSDAGNIRVQYAIIADSVVDAIREPISGASKVATSYITNIDDGGIKVHDAGDTSNYVQIDSNGMDVALEGNSVAYYGREARIGLANNANKVEIQSDRMSMTAFTGAKALDVVIPANGATSKQQVTKIIDTLPTCPPWIEVTSTSYIQSTTVTESSSNINTIVSNDIAVDDTFEVTFEIILNAGFWGFDVDGSLYASVEFTKKSSGTYTETVTGHYYVDMGVETCKIDYSIQCTYNASTNDFSFYIKAKKNTAGSNDYEVTCCLYSITYQQTVLKSRAYIGGDVYINAYDKSGTPEQTLTDTFLYGKKLYMYIDEVVADTALYDLIVALGWDDSDALPSI